MDSPAVQLFAARAQQRNASVLLTDTSAPTMAAICRRLDGLPLAIELAASWADVLSLDTILAGLAQPLSFLTTGPQDLLAHQRSLRDAIAWSFGLLDRPAQTLLARLAVFVGGWSLEAAHGVLGPGHDDVLAQLAMLTRSGLVRATSTAGSEIEYRMLQMIREFALERFRDDPDQEGIRRRFADYYLRLTERDDFRVNAREGWHMGGPLDEANVRGAFQWAVGAGARLRALGLGSALAHWCSTTGRYGEGRAYLQEALALVGSTPTPTRMDVVARYRLAEIELRAGDFGAARQVQLEGLALAEQLGDSRAVGYMLFSLRRTMRRLGLHEEAHRLDVRALELFKQVGDVAGIAVSLDGLGLQAYVEGDFDAARAYFEQVLATHPIPITSYNLGRLAVREGKLEEAEVHYRASLRTNAQRRIIEGIAESLEGFAGLAVARQQDERAFQLAGAADALRDQTGTPLAPWWRTELEWFLRPAVERTGTAERDRAWAQGRVTTMGDAVAYALDESRPPTLGVLAT
jgi:tetratricopeptide (TPR) repeat protein